MLKKCARWRKIFFDWWFLRFRRLAKVKRLQLVQRVRVAPEPHPVKRPLHPILHLIRREPGVANFFDFLRPKGAKNRKKLRFWSEFCHFGSNFDKNRALKTLNPKTELWKSCIFLAFRRHFRPKIRQKKVVYQIFVSHLAVYPKIFFGNVFFNVILICQSISNTCFFADSPHHSEYS